MNIIYQNDIESINSIKNNSHAILFLEKINALFDTKKILPYESYKNVSLGVFLIDKLLSEKFMPFIVDNDISDIPHKRVAKRISKEISDKTKYSKNIHSRVLVKNNIFLANKDYFDENFKLLVKHIKSLNFNVIEDLTFNIEENIEQKEFYNIFDFLVLFRDEEEFSLGEIFYNFKNKRKNIMIESLSNLYLDLIKDNLFIFNKKDQEIILPLFAQFDDKFDDNLSQLFGNILTSNHSFDYLDYVLLSGNTEAIKDFFISKKENFVLTSKMRLEVNFEKCLSFGGHNNNWIKNLETLFSKEDNATNFILSIKGEFYDSHHLNFFEKLFNINLEEYSYNSNNVQEINKNFHKILLPLIPVMLYAQAKNSLDFKDFKDKKIQCFKTLKKCLDDNDIDYINVVNCDNENILHHLIKMKGFSKIKELNDIILSIIQKGCDINHQNNKGYTPLMYITSDNVNLLNRIFHVESNNIDYHIENCNGKNLLTLFNSNSKINKLINKTYEKVILTESVNINNKTRKKKLL